jgi:hypothetical protein
VTADLGRIPELPWAASAVPSPQVEVAESANGKSGSHDDSNTHESVLVRFQQVLNSAPAAAPVQTGPRVSRREQLIEQQREVAGRPFVQKAMELFDVRSGQFRYTPPDSDAT